MYFHDSSPFIWRISDNFGVQWNGLSYMLALIVSLVFVGWMAYRQRSELRPKMITDFVILSAIGGFVGGRLGYGLFYAPDLFLKFRPEFPFWGVFALSEGGMSIFGAILGIVVTSTIFAIRTGINRLYLYDLMSLTAPIGFFFGRIANFLSGEFIGKPAESGLPLAVKFPTEIYLWPKLDPQRLSSLNPIIDKIGLDAGKWKAAIEQYATDSESKTFVNNSLLKIVEAVQSGHSEIRSLLEPMLALRHPAQIYGALGEGVLLFLILFILWYKPRRPGVIAANFLVFYSVIRFFLENYRMPEVFLAPDIWGLTRDQLLSVICFVIGLILLFVWGRRETLPQSGWGRGHSVKLHRR